MIITIKNSKRRNMQSFCSEEIEIMCFLFYFFQNFEKEKEKVAEFNKIESEVINLNIGGYKLTTSLQTLRSDPSSMLGVMFSGRHAITKQDDGSIFFDRDGRHFHIILNYLRGAISSIEELPDDRLALSDLFIEAEYYQLQGLRKIIKLKKTERTALSQSQLDEYFDFGEYNRLETVNCILLKNLSLDNLNFCNIRFKHSLDLSGSSLEDATITDCEFFRGCQYSFDRTNLSNFTFGNNFCYSFGLERLIRNKQITFYDAKNIDSASIYPESTRRAIREMYNL